jgi:hypothetical protein
VQNPNHLKRGIGRKELNEYRGFSTINEVSCGFFRMSRWSYNINGGESAGWPFNVVTTVGCNL